MKMHRYAILPLFALGLAVSGPVMAGEGDSPSVPPESTGATGYDEERNAYEQERDVEVDERDDETAKLPFETDPDQNDPGTGGAGDPGSDSGAAASDGGSAGTGDTGNTGAGASGGDGGGT